MKDDPRILVLTTPKAPSKRNSLTIRTFKSNCLFVAHSQISFLALFGHLLENQNTLSRVLSHRVRRNTRLRLQISRIFIREFNLYIIFKEH